MKFRASSTPLLIAFAFGFKKPVWTRLNEPDRQQDAEGKEKYRLTFSASMLL